VCDTPELDAGGGTDAASIADTGTALDAASDPDASATPDAFVGPDAGAVPGHAVMIGFDGNGANDSIDAMIANAVFLSERPPSGDLRILEYVQYSSPGLELNLHATIAAAASARGRTVAYAELASPGAATLTSGLATADVLLVRPQNLSPGAFATVGPEWHDPVIAFLDAGGVVVILMNENESSGAPHDEWRLAAGAGLFEALSDPTATQGVMFEIATPSDPVAAGVLSPFADRGVCLNMMTGGTPVARTSSTSGVAPLFCPVVRHLVR
jgi:hypothetical protein